MSPLTRRQMLMATATAAAAAGLGSAASCSDDSDSATTGSNAATTAASNTAKFSLIPVFPAGEKYLAATYPQRLPFVLAGSDGAPLDTIDGDLTFTLTENGKQLGDPVVVTPHSAGIQRVYLPVPMMTATAGIIDVATTYQGEALESTVQVWDPTEVQYPQIGNPIPSVTTPTVSAPGDVKPICTADPPCSFHQRNLADSLAAKRPIALLVSTPAYCQTAICGPVLDLLIGQSAGRDNIDFIHAEVYANPTEVASIAEATSSPIVEAFSMVFEPALFLIDSAGVLHQRLDTIFDRDELVAGLDGLS